MTFNTDMLRVIYAECCIYFPYAECRYAGSRGAITMVPGLSPECGVFTLLLSATRISNF
jgi:hypothetical protein